MTCDVAQLAANYAEILLGGAGILEDGRPG